MKLRCPACGSEMTLEEAARGAAFEALGRAQAAFGGDYQLVAEYLDSFKTRREGPLALKKRLRLLREVWEMWNAGRFQIGGEEYVVGREEFREALAQVANRELSGLKNHNYLKQVLKAAARKTSARQEAALKDRETRLQAGWREDQEEPLADPRLPRLLHVSLFGNSQEERDEAKALIEQIRREAQETKED